MENWVSNLPDDVVRIIIHHLLGDPATTNKTALQFGLLSKDLWRAVHSRSAFLFEYKNHHHHDINCKCLKELKYMISALEQNTHLENLTFRCLYPCTAEVHSNFDRCIELAATNGRGLRNLTLNMAGPCIYALPRAVFLVKSLVQLDLQRCHLPAFGSMITWPNLKRLHLTDVKVGDGMIENIDRACPAIEILEIISCFFNTDAFHIKVPNLSYLRQLKLWLRCLQTFQVDANVLQNLECLASSHLFENVDFGKYEYHKLRSLSVIQPRAFRCDFHQFPRLEELSIIEPGKNIKRINISSLSLKKIFLGSIWDLEEATFDVPNILEFEYNKSSSTVVPNLSFAGNSSGWISRMTLFESNESIKEPWWILKLKEFLAALESPVTSIQVCCENLINTHHEFSIETHPFPECVVKQLSICTKWIIGKVFLQSLAFGIIPDIFSIFRPQRITLTDWQCEFPELLYDNLVGLNHPKFQNLRCNVTGIHMRYENRVLKQSQVLDKDEFLKLLQISHLKMDTFTIVFELDWIT